MRRLLASLLLFIAASSLAQTTTVPASGTARRVIRAAALPATCSVSDVYFKTAATVGLNVCLTANNWSAVTIGGITEAAADLRYLKLAADNDPLTGALTGAAGTAGLPSFSFVGEADTGMYLFAANSIGFPVGGVDKWVMSSSGGLNCATDGGCDIGNGAADPRDLSLRRNLVLRGATSGAVTISAPAVAGAASIVTDTLLVSGGALGTPSSGVGTNLTGTAAGLTAGNVTTNANLTGPITSTGNATAVASQTGTGSTFVMNTGATVVTPTISGNFALLGGSTWTVDSSAANIVEVYNQSGTGSTSWRLYRNRVDASNYERVTFGWFPDFRIDVSEAGSGTQWPLSFSTAGTVRMGIGGTGDITISNSASKGSCTLDGGATATCTAAVPSGCKPICTYQSATLPHAVACSVTTTTLTAVSDTTLDGGVVNFFCF